MIVFCWLCEIGTGEAGYLESFVLVAIAISCARLCAVYILSYRNYF